ncbi:MAG: phage holin family protein [Gammaproteobacteria bacterium]|nr:phage holin family protein [Gammaproteobacteria bacterium]
MEEENKVSFTGLITNLFQTSFKLVSDTISLANAEAHLAGRSLKEIVILSFFLAALLSTTWFCVIAMIVCYLVSMHFSWLAALSTVTLLNIFLMIVIGIVMLKLKHNLTFPATRRQLQFSGNK